MREIENMKGLFCYDGPISCDNDGNYFGTVLNDQVFKRYFTVVNSLNVAIRIEEQGQQTVKTSQIKLEHLNFIKIPNISSIKGIILKKKATEILKKSIKEADIIFIRLPSFIGNLAVTLAKKMNKPYLIEMVGCPWDSLWNHSIKGKVVAPLMWFKTRRYIKNGEYIVYVTNNFLQNRYPTKGKFTNCSNVELQKTEDVVLKRRIEYINETKDKLIIGTAAAVNVRYKGQEYLIEALGKLKLEGIIDYKYQLVGGGDTSYLKHIAKKNNVEDQVEFLGEIPHEKVFEWLDKIDLYIQPSRQEGLPRALIEAMSRAVPSFGAKTGGIPELLEDEFVFSNTQKNIDEIIKILNLFNIETMTRQAQRNYEESKKYDKEIITERRKKFFLKFMRDY